MIMKGVGRPKGFDEAAALGCAVDLFWTKGYAATTIDDLLVATGIARSSFYSTFGSKHQVLLAALKMYTDELWSRIQAAADAKALVPAEALRAVVKIVACSERPSNGCLFINMVTELAPTDPDVRKLSSLHLAKVDDLMTSLLILCGWPASQARNIGGSLMAMATGAITMRKSGHSQARIEKMLKSAERLIERPL